jgi:hypothetical protein
MDDLFSFFSHDTQRVSEEKNDTRHFQIFKALELSIKSLKEATRTQIWLDQG